MAYYNEQLQELQKQKARKNQLEYMLKSLRSQRDELIEKVSELEKYKLEEQADVDKLEGRSLAAFFYNVVGKFDEKIDKERQEAYAAKVKYDAVVRELESVEEEIRRGEEEIFTLQNCEKRYEKLMKEKTESVKASGSKEAEEILQLEEKLAYIESQKKEIEEAVSEGECAMRIAERVMKRLDSAEGWGTWDLLGGGLIADMAKHSELDEAQELAEELQMQLRHFKTELADVTIYTDLKVNIEGFLRFADYFFDGLFADWTVLDQISQARQQVNSTMMQIGNVQEKLRALLETIQGEYNVQKARVTELVMKIDI